MAYMNQEKKKKLAPTIKQVLKKHNMKGTLSVDNYSTLRLTLNLVLLTLITLIETVGLSET